MEGVWLKVAAFSSQNEMNIHPDILWMLFKIQFYAYSYRKLFHVFQWPTSMRWELTFLPFLFQLTLGLGSPVAWHTNETTPPETPIWSTGTLVNRGETGEKKDNGENIKPWQEESSACLRRSRSAPPTHPHGPESDPVESWLQTDFRKQDDLGNGDGCGVYRTSAVDV